LRKHSDKIGKLVAQAKIHATRQNRGRLPTVEEDDMPEHDDALSDRKRYDEDEDEDEDADTEAL
jgi:hypothetical protein